MQLSSSKRRVSRCLPKLLLLSAACVLVLIVFSAGYIEEWVLRPSPNPFAAQSFSQTRREAANFNRETLEREASRFYRVSNPRACHGSPVFLLGFVASKPAHFQSRRAIRSSWASVTEVQGRVVRTLFAVGVPESEEERELIGEESERYQDLVQGLFVDTYLNLTHKTIMIMRWFSTYCPSAQYLLKVDDDVFLNYHNLVGHLIGLGDGQEDLYLGRVHRKVRAVRNSSSLYYVPESVYPGKIYPNYCSGTSYVVSKDVAYKVYVVALSLPLLTIEDVFVGICAKKVGVWPTHTSKMSGGPRFHFSRCCYKSIYASHHISADEFVPIWRLVNDSRDCSVVTKYAALFVCNFLNLVDVILAA
ncbi:beta-1,3-galactosyltransferase 9-like [Heptranchias perlo]|uniref:beta-1,3-galactosyltransferase 9-like n=1 Tax=Heptranchias perlo TaxID=212740 RepID=UPI00355A93E6